MTSGTPEALGVEEGVYGHITGAPVYIARPTLPDRYSLIVSLPVYGPVEGVTGSSDDVHGPRRRLRSPPGSRDVEHLQSRPYSIGPSPS